MGLFSWLFGNNKEANKIAKQGYGQAQDRNNSTYNTILGQLPGQIEKDNALRTDITGKYGDVFNNASAANNPAYGGFSEFSHTGGIRPQDEADVNRNIGDYRDLSAFGQDWMKTGGFTKQGTADFRSRGTSGIADTFAALKNNLSTNRSAQGGYNPGYTAQASKMSRDSAHTMQDARLNTEVSLADQIRQGKVAGANINATGISGAQGARMGLMDMISRGKEFGLSGLAGLGQNENATKLAATSGLSGLYSSSPAWQSLLAPLLSTTGQGADITHNYSESQRQKAHFAEVMQGIMSAIAASQGLPSKAPAGASGGA